jgi:CRP-like cAMP-binding protein
MSTDKAQLIDVIQKYLGKSNWNAAVAEMEKLFTIDPDPMIRVRMGDAYQKLNQKAESVKEYIRAADLFAAKGVIVRALALYKLALRLDPQSKPANEKMASLHLNKAMTEKRPEPFEEGAVKPARSVIPLFAGLTQEEFDDFTKMMAVHILQPGQPIVKQGDTGQSVYVIANGSVKVWTLVPSGERLDLAVLNANEFFGEMSFLTGNPRTATVETAEDAVILEVTEDKLRDLVTRRPRVLQVLEQYSASREKGTSAKIQSTQKAPEPAAEKALKPKVPESPTMKAVSPAAPQPKSQGAAPEKAPSQKAPSSPEKAKLLDTIQKHIGKAEWKSVIAEMERLFIIEPDPIIRVRIGDAYQKLNNKAEAVKEYIRAADLYGEKGAVVKALAQYKLALRVDPVNKPAAERIEALHSNKAVKEVATGQAEQDTNKPQKAASSVIPLFAGFSQEEFNAFTKVMNVHPLPARMPIVEQNDTGKSVYVIASGSVKIFTTLLSGDRVDLASLGSGDFFGEISFLTGKPRTATVETTEDSIILEVTEDKLREITVQKPGIMDMLKKYSETRTKGTMNKILESEK